MILVTFAVAHKLEVNQGGWGHKCYAVEGNVSHVNSTQIINKQLHFDADEDPMIHSSQICVLGLYLAPFI